MDETLSMQETTQPEAAPAEETTAIDTSSADSATETDGSTEVATPSAETGSDGENAETVSDTDVTGEESAVSEPASAPVVRVKFNKQEREYTVDDAAPLVEMGLKYESLKPDFEKLKFLATTSEKSVSELIDSLVKASDDALYSRVLEECGGNEAVAKKLFEYQKTERQNKFESAKSQESEKEKADQEADQKDFINRMAANFTELQKEVPGQFKEFKDIPRQVVDASMKNKISLLDSWLRYQHAESKKSEAVKAKQAEAAKKSTGSMNGEQTAPEPELEDFSKAFHGTLWR